MRQRDKEKPNKTTPENTKHPTQEPAEEIYSLEDILAEYGTRRSTVRTAVPVNSPLDQPEGKVLAFPRRPVPTPQEEPEDSDAPEEPETASPPDQTEQEPESSSPQQEEEEQEASQEEEEEDAGEDDSGVVEFPPEESCCPLCSSVWAARPTGMPTRCFRSRRRWTRRRSAVWRS